MQVESVFAGHGWLWLLVGDWRLAVDNGWLVVGVRFEVLVVFWLMVIGVRWLVAGRWELGVGSRLIISGWLLLGLCWFGVQWLV